jgi:hypothetical protein
MKTKYPFGMMLKTYSKDFEYAKRLIDSLIANNIEKIPLTIVVPKFDLPLFKELSNNFIKIIADEDVTNNLIENESYWGLPAGYINQEIIKLAFWEVSEYENYLCIDSDCVFIRNFTISDFMHDSITPYFFVTEDAELRADNDYYEKYGRQREFHLQSILKAIDFHPPYLLTSHQFSVFSCAVMRSFKCDFMDVNQFQYNDLMKISPYEFSWYNFWQQKCKIIDMHIREPIIKIFHTKIQHLLHIRRGAGSFNLARSYVAVVVNSNFSREHGLLGIDASEDDYRVSIINQLASYLKMIKRWASRKLRF